MNELQNILFDNISQLVGYDQINSIIKTNHKSDDNQTIFEIFIPGLSRENIKVTIENNHIVVKTAANQASSNRKFLRSEFNYNGLERKYRIDEDYDINSLDVKYENGVLQIKYFKKPIFYKEIEIK